MIHKIAYFWLPVTDMNRAVEFYHQLLGFKNIVSKRGLVRIRYRRPTAGSAQGGLSPGI